MRGRMPWSNLPIVLRLCVSADAAIKAASTASPASFDHFAWPNAAGRLLLPLLSSETEKLWSRIRGPALFRKPGTRLLRPAQHRGGCDRRITDLDAHIDHRHVTRIDGRNRLLERLHQIAGLCH